MPALPSSVSIYLNEKKYSRYKLFGSWTLDMFLLTSKQMSSFGLVKNWIAFEYEN